MYDPETGESLETFTQDPGPGTASSHLTDHQRLQAWQCEPDTCVSLLRIEKAVESPYTEPSPAIFTYSGDVADELTWTSDPFGPLGNPSFSAVVFGSVTVVEIQPDGWTPVSVACDAGAPQVDLTATAATVNLQVQGLLTTFVFTSRGSEPVVDPPIPPPDDPDPSPPPPDRRDCSTANTMATAHLGTNEDGPHLFSTDMFVVYCRVDGSVVPQLDRSWIRGELNHGGFLAALDAFLGITFVNPTGDGSMSW